MITIVVIIITIVIVKVSGSDLRTVGCGVVRGHSIADIRSCRRRGCDGAGGTERDQTDPHRNVASRMNQPESARDLPAANRAGTR